MFFRSLLGVKKGNIGLKWVDNYFRELINIRNNATLIINGINVQITISTNACNNNVIKGATIFISEKIGSCECYFKSDIPEFEFDYTNKIKLKTFIDKIRNLAKFSIFFFFFFV